MSTYAEVRDLAGDHDQPGRQQGLAGHAARGVLLEDRVEDRVRDLVGHLVGMAFGDRLGGERVVLHCVRAFLGRHERRGLARAISRLCESGTSTSTAVRSEDDNCVGVVLEARARGGDVVGDDEVDVLRLELGRAFARQSVVSAAKPTMTWPRPLPGAELGEDVGRRLEDDLAERHRPS